MNETNDNALFLGGWICLWRRIANSTLWMDEKFTKGQAWVDLLLLAQGVYNAEVRDGVYREFHPGVVYWSVSALADRWKWNRKTAKSYLETLEKAGMICLYTKPKCGSIITILNWNEYQGGEKRTGHGKMAEDSKRQDMGKGQKLEKCGQIETFAAQGFEGDFQGVTGQMTGQMTGQIDGQMTGHNITIINKDKRKINNSPRSQSCSQVGSAPLLEGGGPPVPSKTKADIPEQWRDDFGTYEEYWRWRNQ